MTPTESAAQFASFYRANYAVLYRYIQKKITGDGLWRLRASDVEDVVALTMEQMLQRWETIDAPVSYMFQTGSRLAYRFHRGLADQGELTEHSEREENNPHTYSTRLSTAASLNPETDPVRAAVGIEFLAVATSSMTMAEKQVFMRRIAGYPNAVIAEDLGVTTKAVQHRYDRAKSKALHSLQRAEFLSPDFGHESPLAAAQSDPIDWAI